MRSVHRAAGTCPSLALHVADVYGNSLERTFLASSPPAPPAPNCCMVAALHPFLGHPTAAPLCIHEQKLLPTAASPLPGMQIFSGPVAEGPWGLEARGCAMSSPHGLWLRNPGAELPQRCLSFTGEALKG